jgi:CLIP-associating protein 1/2
VMKNFLTRFVSQACHLLNVLSKELLSDFEACAEIFIPVILEVVSLL